MKRPALLLRSLLLLALAGAALWYANSMITAVFYYRSPLRNSPPAPVSPAAPPLSDRVVVVLIDALRYDTALNAAVMPVLNDLRARGAQAVMHSRPSSFSQPGYSTLLTGAWPEINDGPAMNVPTGDIWTFTQDDLFSSAARAGLRTGVSAYDWFEKLLPAGVVSDPFYTRGEDAAADRQVVDAALGWLRAGQTKLVLIHIDQVDYAGHHEGGPRDPRWNAAAARADSLLGEILSTLDLNNDTLLVVSDHGQIDAGGHGGTDPVTLVEPFVLAGKGVLPGDFGDVQMVDVAPTVAALLGAGAPASNQGRPLLEMLAFDPAQKEALRAADTVQKESLLAAYRKAVGVPGPVNTPPARGSATAPQSAAGQELEAVRDTRLARERLARGLGIGIPVLLAAAWFALRLRRDALSRRALLAGLVYAAGFHLIYTLVDRHPYTFSWVPGVSGLIVYILLRTAAAFLLALLVALPLRRLFRQSGRVERASAVLSAGWVTWAITALPVVYSLFLNGPLPVWTLPDFPSTYLALLQAVQAGGVGILTVILAGLALATGPRDSRAAHSL